MRAAELLEEKDNYQFYCLPEPSLFSEVSFSQNSFRNSAQGKSEDMGSLQVLT